jgi:hypothetical protein
MTNERAVFSLFFPPSCDRFCNVGGAKLLSSAWPAAEGRHFCTLGLHQTQSRHIACGVVGVLAALAGRAIRMLNLEGVASGGARNKLLSAVERYHPFEPGAPALR